MIPNYVVELKKEKERLTVTVSIRRLISYFVYFGIPSPFVDEEIGFLKKIVKKGDTVVDIGANVGLYSLRLSKLVGDNGQVLSFEPFRPSFDILSKTISRLKIKNITCINEALGNTDELVSLKVPRLGSGRVKDPFVNIDPMGKGSIKMTTLDTEIYKSKISSISFIKVDTEGYEYFVFKGAQETIVKYQPIILTEINNKWAERYGISGSDVDGLLSSFGYESFILGAGRLKKIKIENSTYENFFYLPSKKYKDLL